MKVRQLRHTFMRYGRQGPHTDAECKSPAPKDGNWVHKSGAHTERVVLDAE